MIECPICKGPLTEPLDPPHPDGEERLTFVTLLYREKKGEGPWIELDICNKCANRKD